MADGLVSKPGCSLKYSPTKYSCNNPALLGWPISHWSITSSIHHVGVRHLVGGRMMPNEISYLQHGPAVAQ
jgi:hypothetical protein